MANEELEKINTKGGVVASDKDSINLEAIPFSKKDIEEIFAFKQKIETGISEEEAREQVKNLRKEVERNYFKMGGLLYRISREYWYKKWGFSSFEEYVAKELGYTIRKAQFLIQIWNWFVIQVGDKEVIEKVSQVGWSKAVALAGVVTPQNVDEWVDKALKKTTVQLNEEVRSFLKGQEQPQTVNRMTFVLYEDQYMTVEEALKLACEAGKTDKKSHALSLICLDYLASNAKKLDLRRSLLQHIKRIEKIVPGVGFIVVDLNKKEKIYVNPNLEADE